MSDEAVFQSIIQIGTDSTLVANLATIMTNCYFLFHYRQVKSRTEKKNYKKKLFYRDILLSVLAFRSLGTKSNQPIRAHYFPYMPYQIYLWSFVRKTVFKVGYVFLMIVVSHAEFGRNDIRGAYSTLINWIPSMNIYISGVPCTLSLSILILNVKRAP